MTLKRQAVEKPLRLDLVKPALKGVKDLQTAIAEALDKDPAKRPTANAWLQALQTAATTLQVEVSAAALPESRAKLGSPDGSASDGDAAARAAADAKAAAQQQADAELQAQAQERQAAQQAEQAQKAQHEIEAKRQRDLADAQTAAATKQAEMALAAAQEAASRDAQSTVTLSTDDVKAALARTAIPAEIEDEDDDEEDVAAGAPGATTPGFKGKRGKKNRRDNRPTATLPVKIDTPVKAETQAKAETPIKADAAQADGNRSGEKAKLPEPIVPAASIKVDLSKGDLNKGSGSKTVDYKGPLPTKTGDTKAPEQNRLW